ncbi:MAG: SDR family oxidoreductase [Ignavibacteria bacterium]|jgi:short-subunit dehydrogenase
MKDYTLITGASGGIGLELSHLFAKDGYNLVLVARSGDKLDALSKELTDEHKIHVKVISEDLSKPSSAKEIYERVREQSLPVTVLINNAGFGSAGMFADTDIKNEIDMIQVNVLSLIELTKLFLHDMMERKNGKILNVASTAAFAPGPLMSVYYASKAFVLSFSGALSDELKGTGISVTALCPGPTGTGFQERSHVETTRLFAFNVMDAKTVASIGYRGLMKGKTIVIPGIMNKMLIGSMRISPRKLVVKIIRWLQENRKPA